MITDQLVLAVLVGEAALLALGLGVLFGYAAWRGARTAWLRPRIRATRTAVSQTLASNQNLPTVPWMPQKEVVRVLAEATRTVDMAARERLTTLPIHARLLSRAERRCGSRRWPRRLKGARLLTILAAGDNVVAPLLDDARPEVRSEAAAWVAHHPTPARVTRLIQMLDDDALSCRLVARATLIRLGRRSVRPVVCHLTSAQPAALVSTLDVAARLTDPAILGPALAHRSSTDPAARTAVADVLASLGGLDAIRALQELLEDPHAGVRATAAAGLGALAHWPSAPLLAHRLGDPAWQVRRAAGLALLRLSAPGRVYLQRARQSEDAFASDMAQQVLDLPESTTRELH